MLLDDYHLLIVSGRESHFVARVALIKEISFAKKEAEKGFDEALDSSNLTANCQVKLIESLLAHFKISIYIELISRIVINID